MRIRHESGLGLSEAISPFDIAERLGVDVRFVPIASLEGMYLKRAPEATILLPAERPAGRLAFSCSHEIGHHAFGHGSKIDQYLDHPDPGARFDPEEFIADVFAGFLLMPKVAVEHGLAVRCLTPAATSPQQLYCLACWLGVGYETLITHMRFSLGTLSAARATELLRTTPKQIRQELLGYPCDSDLLVVDENWTDRAIDLRTGDYVLLASDTEFDGSVLEDGPPTPGRRVMTAKAAGVGHLISAGSGWSASVRVARRGFVGRAVFRHVEDAESD